MSAAVVRLTRSTAVAELRASRSRLLHELRRLEWEFDRHPDHDIVAALTAVRDTLSEIELLIANREFSDRRYYARIQAGDVVQDTAEPSRGTGLVTHHGDEGIEVAFPGLRNPVLYENGFSLRVT